MAGGPSTRDGRRRDFQTWTFTRASCTLAVKAGRSAPSFRNDVNHAQMILPPAVRRPIPIFAAISLAAVVLGALVCAMSGVPAGLWMRNLAAWGVGLLAAVALASWAGPRAAYAAAVLALLGLCASLVSPGLDGVHRWFAIGPVRINAAMLLSPALVVATAVLATRGWWGWLPAMLALVVLAWQPDASQATALALAVCVLAAARRTDPLAPRIAVAAAAITVAGWTWTRPDPLQPVPEVEGIILLANSHSLFLAVACVLLLAALAASPILATRGGQPEGVAAAGVSLAALFAGWVVAPALGAFPVPIVGVGLSPILGAWLGIGLLASLTRAQARPNG